MMGSSLQDQFLKMGLVDKKKFNQSKKEKHKKKVKPDSGKDEIAEMAKQALAEKKKRDQQLNKKKIAERKIKEDNAKARQLIETHRIEFEQGNVPFNFKEENKVKKIFLSEKAVERLVSGKAGIVKIAGGYQFVPANIIYKIKDLNPKMVLLLNSQQSKSAKDEDDPYSDFEVPDDLMW